jgi:DNA mismatch repair protein MutL
MVKRIHVLPDQVVNKIAAGEVVERPAAAVKELVENALDAGSTEITIELRQGGKQLVRVADNGTGMHKDDALLALERHATSKLEKIEDLETITSLGFRGEALPSIAAVSHLVLATRPHDEVEGTVITVEGGTITSVTAGARSAGTTVEVNNLFFNVPARRKFLKSVDTELRHISKTFIEFALAHHDKTFVLQHDGQEIYRLYPVVKLEDRAMAIHGKSVAGHIIPFTWQRDGLLVSGLLGKPDIARGSQYQQITYVNRRVISSRLINHAIMEGYHTLLPKGQYPFIVLFLDINPKLMDVNVHPTKREVRFADENWIHQGVARAIKEGLVKANLIPEMTMPSGETPSGQTRPAPLIGSYQERVTNAMESFLRQASTAPAVTTQPDFFQTLPRPQGLSVREPSPRESVAQDENLAHLWQLHQSFIFAQIKGGVLVIDQHAAHERILFEEITGSLAGTAKTAQQLLFPITLELSHPEFSLLEEIVPLLQQIGFGIRMFGGTTAIIDAIPTSVKNWQEGKMLKEILDEMLQHGRVSSGLKERLAASYACKAAVKAGDPLKPEEMSYLISRLFSTSNPYTCPHGRPAVIKMTVEELNRLFGRT